MKSVLNWIGIGFVVLVICVLVILGASYFLPPGSAFGDAVLVTLAGVVLSLLFTYMPKLRVQFAGLASETKQLVNLILSVLLAAIVFAFTCTNFVIFPGVECTKDGVIAVVVYIFLAAGGNQLTYKLSPQPADVKAAKVERDLTQG